MDFLEMAMAELRVPMRQVMDEAGVEEGKKMVLEALDDVLKELAGGSVCRT